MIKGLLGRGLRLQDFGCPVLATYCRVCNKGDDDAAFGGKSQIILRNKSANCDEGLEWTMGGGGSGL